MLNKITERIYYLPADECNDRPILGYIKGDNISLMVDAGNSKEHVEVFLEELNKMKLEYPRYVGITHWHWNHCYGMCGIKAPSIASSKTNKKLKEMSKWKWSEKDINERLKNEAMTSFCYEKILKEYQNISGINVKEADIVFEDRLLVDLGNLECHLINIDNSHSEDSVIIWIPKEKMLFLGDTHYKNYSAKEPKYYKEKLRKLISFLYETEFSCAVTGQEGPITRKELIKQLEIEYRALM